MTTDLAQKIILITGASRGIGRAMALDYASCGAKILAVARTEGALQELDDQVQQQGGEQISIITADLAKSGTIEQLMTAIRGRFGRLDGMVGNAALLGALSPITHCDAKDLSQVMSLNFMANFELIKYGDDLLRAAPAGRALFITSSVATRARAYWGPYAISKAALQSLVLTYSREVLQTALKVNILNPGPVRTNMRAKAFPGEDPMTLPEPALIAQFARQYLTTGCPCHGEIIDFKQGII